MHLIACLLAGGAACHPHEDITDRRRCGSVERRDGVSPRRVPPCGRTVVCQDGRGDTPPVAYTKARSVHLSRIHTKRKIHLKSRLPPTSNLLMREGTFRRARSHSSEFHGSFLRLSLTVLVSFSALESRRAGSPLPSPLSIASG